MDKWERDRDLVMYRGCVYVPKDPQLHHNSMMTGHPGWWKTLELVSCNYWWPGISYCQGASETGVDREKLRAMLLINPTKSTLLLILN